MKTHKHKHTSTHSMLNRALCEVQHTLHIWACLLLFYGAFLFSSMRWCRWRKWAHMGSKCDWNLMFRWNFDKFNDFLIFKSVKNSEFYSKNYYFLLIIKLNKKVLKSETCKVFENKNKIKTAQIKYSTLWKMTGDEAIKRNHNIAVWRRKIKIKWERKLLELVYGFALNGLFFLWPVCVH